MPILINALQKLSAKQDSINKVNKSIFALHVFGFLFCTTMFSHRSSIFVAQGIAPSRNSLFRLHKFNLEIKNTVKLPHSIRATRVLVRGVCTTGVYVN